MPSLRVLFCTAILASSALTACRRGDSRTSGVLRQRDTIAPGQTFMFASLLQDTLRGRITHWNPNAPTVLLVIPPGSCLTCMVELKRWNGFPRPSVAALGILLGRSTDFAERVRREEHLLFPLIGDPDSSSLRGMVLPSMGVVRILTVDGRVAIVARGRDEGPVGFVEGSGALTRAQPELRPSAP